jgi:4-diphosphocytidyl-2-C-methyl-D-erythritol kinase
MEKIIAPAKLNLALDVLYRRPDRYHEVDMIMQSLSLADELTLESSKNTKLTCNNPNLVVDENNLVWKAVRLIQQKLGINFGVQITLQKSIPIAAGLAGGSADAAATLIGLNRLWKLNLTPEELMGLGITLGADVPFCIFQGAARARGIGEQLTPLNSRLKCHVFIVTPNIAIATPEVYRRLKTDQLQQRPRINEAIEALISGAVEELFLTWGNVLETAVLPYYPEVRWLKELFQECGIKHCLMSGSGPSIFCLNPPSEAIELIVSKLPTGWFHYLCEFKNRLESN